jgi:hypothetical protein
LQGTLAPIRLAGWPGSSRDPPLARRARARRFSRLPHSKSSPQKYFRFCILNGIWLNGPHVFGSEWAENFLQILKVGVLDLDQHYLVLPKILG